MTFHKFAKKGRSANIEAYLLSKNMFQDYPIVTIICSIMIVYGIAYTLLYTLFLSRVKKEEHAILFIFLRKISKVPALIETMRSYIAKKEAFDPLIRVHTESMIESNNTLYDILEHNARVQNEFSFLMQLSSHTKSLQKDEYFIYIRDFILSYERDMRGRFDAMNRSIRVWNSFIHIKNATGIGFFLPGSEMAEVV